MITQEVICKGCEAKLEVNSWRKFVMCPYCETKTQFKGFEYKKINRNDSMYVHMKWEQDCPVCRSPHMLASSRLGKWRCADCSYMMSGVIKLIGVLWFCDNCESYMNIQQGFTTKKKNGFAQSVDLKMM